MKIQTFSIVVGTSACDANCPFCISHTTGFDQIPKNRDINWRNFDKACKLAQLAGTTTVLLTGKGEPSLYPQEILLYVRTAADHFPFIELQTNAIRIGHLAQGNPNKATPLDISILKRWFDAGLNTIAISVVDILTENNQKVYHEDYPDLSKTIDLLHEIGFTVRLCVMMQNGMVDNPDRVHDVVNFCRSRRVAQLTMRPIRRPILPVLSGNKEADYVDQNGLSQRQIDVIADYIETAGTHISTIMNGGHAAKVYDILGQNLCLSDCLTVEPSNDDIRTLIFYPDGHLYTDWQFTGARLL